MAERKAGESYIEGELVALAREVAQAGAERDDVLGRLERAYHECAELRYKVDRLTEENERLRTQALPTLAGDWTVGELEDGVVYTGLLAESEAD